MDLYKYIKERNNVIVPRVMNEKDNDFQKCNKFIIVKLYLKKVKCELEI